MGVPPKTNKKTTTEENKSQLYTDTKLRWNGFFNIKCMHITRWIDRTIVLFCIMIFAKKFALKCFKKVIIFISTQAEIFQSNTQMNRCSIWFRIEYNKLQNRIDKIK